MTTRTSAIGYTGATFDRAHERRQDTVWLSEQIALDRFCIVPVWQDRNLVGAEDGRPPFAVFWRGDAAARFVDAAGTLPEGIFLGVERGEAVFALDVSTFAEDVAAQGMGRFSEIRGLSAVLPADELALMATARGLCHWHRSHRFCGICGSPTQSREGGHARACQNPDCQSRHYPRLDPAVIMLVESKLPTGQPVCLLAHNARFPSGMYSTLAGFVEIGETLEQAVAREVAEEVGAVVMSVAYCASQPWPFPSSIMLGFRAQAIYQDLCPDGEEVADARWLTVDDVLSAADWEDETASFRLPRRDSIARFMIEDWLQAHR